MTNIFAIETSARTAGLAIRNDADFRFYASDHAFVPLEGRAYVRLEDIRADVRRLAETPAVPNASRRGGKRRARPARR
jgi:hypothetical protein